MAIAVSDFIWLHLVTAFFSQVDRNLFADFSCYINSHYRKWWPESCVKWDGQGIQLFPESKFVFCLLVFTAEYLTQDARRSPIN